LSAETAGDDPDLLLALATIEFAEGKETDARTAMARVLALAPEREAEVTRLADELITAGRVESAYACVDAITDAALLKDDIPRAVAVLQKFVEQDPHIPALAKLVAIAADAKMLEALRPAQGLLADAYLDASMGDEARVVAEDLVRTDPASDAHADRLRRALVMLGVTDSEQVIVRVRAGAARQVEDDDLLPMENPDFSDVVTGIDEAGVLPEVDVFVYPDNAIRDVPDPPLDLSLEPPDEMPGGVQDPTIYGDSAVTLEASEIDLSGALSGLMSSSLDIADQTDESAPDAAEPPEDIEDVFAQMRAKSAREQQASAALGQYEQALQYLDQGLVKEAITELEGAAKVPMLRFRAAAQLGRVYLEGGDVAAGVEWLERAAEAPAPTPEEGHAVLYDLAAALQTHGESSRALAILMELDTDANGFRDVRDRIAQLTRAQTGSHSG
jgi:lipopolysaccharide biosynthesis regulator YciM